MMHPQLFPISRIFFVAVVVALLIRLPVSSAQANEQYLNCSNLFQCGTFKEIGYPFWGANRPQPCGHPSFFLNCTGEEAPIITIQSRPYRVLSIDNATYTLNVVRKEFYNNTCPQYLNNATLDTDHFNYASDAEELALYYNCSARLPTLVIPNEFPCLANGTVGTFGIYVSSSLTSTVSSSYGCTTSVRVWVNSTEGQSLLANAGSTSPGNLTRVLDSGFGLEYNASNGNCEQCVASGGVCGSNSASNSASFVCYCPDGDYAVRCGSNQTGGGTSTF